MSCRNRRRRRHRSRTSHTDMCTESRRSRTDRGRSDRSESRRSDRSESRRRTHTRSDRRSDHRTNTSRSNGGRSNGGRSNGGHSNGGTQGTGTNTSRCARSSSLFGDLCRCLGEKITIILEGDGKEGVLRGTLADVTRHLIRLVLSHDNEVCETGAVVTVPMPKIAAFCCIR